MSVKEGLNDYLINAIRLGRLKNVGEIIHSIDLHGSLNWEGEYDLLLHATENDYPEITKFLLNIGSRVNIPSVKPSNTPLHYAVMNGDISIVEMFVARNADVNAQNAYGRTPFHNAVERNEIKITELLINTGANINACDRNGITPLHLAAERFKEVKIVELFFNSGMNNSAHMSTFKNNDAMMHNPIEENIKENINLLLNSGTNVNDKDNEGNTALHILTESGNLEIIEYLLIKGADVNTERKDGITALHIAAARGCLQIVECLLKYDANVDSVSTTSHTPLYLAVINGHENIVKLLLVYGANVDYHDKDGKTILSVAIDKGFLTIVDHILKYCPDMYDKNNRKCLEVAVCGYGKESNKIVKSLLQYGFTVQPENENYFGFLCAAVQKGYLNIVEDLLKCNSVSNSLSRNNFYILLCSAIRNKQEHIVKLLISYGVKVNVTKYETGKALILCAVEQKNLEITKLLLTNGATVDSYPDPLHVAVMLACMEIVELLLQHGTDINACDERGRTALHFTCTAKGKFKRYTNNIHGKAKVAELLLHRGADIDAQDKDGMATLHTAVQNGFDKVVEVLLEHSANINAVNKNDLTPLSLAIQNKDEILCQMLGQHIVKMQTASLYVNEKNLPLNYNYDTLINKCEKEIEIIKKQKIMNSITLYDVLTKCVSQLAIYARNEDVICMLKASDFKIKYPIYANIISGRFRKGVERIPLHNQGIEFLYAVFNTLPILPFNCVEKILSYLSNNDIRILTDRCHESNVSCPDTNVDDGMPVLKKLCISY